jgi:hypothetical protein
LTLLAPLPATGPLPLDASALDVEAEIHDRQQLELRFNYEIGKLPGRHRYQLDAYLFVPKPVGLNSSNYSRDQFYADVTALMRLDAKPLPLDELARVDAPASPLFDLTQMIESFRVSRRPPTVTPLIVQVKLYAYLYTTGVHTEIAVVKARLAELAEGPEPEARARIEREVAGALTRMRDALWAYRTVRARFWPFEMLADRTFADAMRTSDEFMSLFLEERIALLALSLDEDPRYVDGSGSAARLRLRFMALAREEAAYRAKYGYLNLTKPAEQGEYGEYRLSLLKKSVHNALYLDARAVSSDHYFRNAISVIGAALAAIWALAATPSRMFSSLGGGTPILLFVGAVFAYAVKDRVKNLTNEFLMRRLRQHDHMAWIEGRSLAAMGLGMLRIRLREAMAFLSSTSVPREIRDLRLSRRTVRFAEAGQEEVIHYKKELLIKKPSGAQIPEGFRVRDILRLNVRHFLVRLDDPIDPVAYFDPALGAFAAAKLPKVYHVNVVLRVQRFDDEKHGIERFERHRVVINKEGIVRVDLVDVVGPVPLGAKA